MAALSRRQGAAAYPDLRYRHASGRRLYGPAQTAHLESRREPAAAAAYAGTGADRLRTARRPHQGAVRRFSDASDQAGGAGRTHHRDCHAGRTPLSAHHSMYCQSRFGLTDSALTKHVLAESRAAVDRLIAQENTVYARLLGRSVFLQTDVQGYKADAENICRPFFDAAAEIERGEYQFPVHVGQRGAHRNSQAQSRRRLRAHGQRQRRGIDNLIRQDKSALNMITLFEHIARPMIGGKTFEHILRQHLAAIVPGIEVIQKMLSQQDDVRATFTQRRYL